MKKFLGEPRRALVTLFGVTLATVASGQTFTEFAVPEEPPIGIAAGADGALWFTEAGGNQIGRVTTAGVFTEFPIPTSSSLAGLIAAGPDGALWFTERSGNKIGRITTAGVITEFAIPTAGSTPMGITAGPDGALWFTEIAGNKIGRISASGVITEFALPTAGSQPIGIAAGPDGALWFTEFTGNKIGRITPAGVTTEFALPTASSLPLFIAAGPDGALWFTESGRNKIGRITTGGVLTEFAIPTANSEPTGIAAGQDGALWFTEFSGNKIGRITTAGVLAEFAVPTANSQPVSITAGPDGALWFTEQAGSKIWRIGGVAPASSSVTVPISASIHGASSTFFHSDVRVLNRSATGSVTVTAKYRCFAPPCGNSPQTFTLAPREMRVFDDMIAATFNAAESGGAIEFSSTGSLVVTSRLYTPSRPSPTTGMGVPGVLETQALPAAVVTSLSHSADPTQGFRSNVGAYNPNDVAQTITFTVYDANGVQLGLATSLAPARTPVQVSDIFRVIGLTRDISHGYCVVKGDQNLPLLAYAGVIDNQSQDLAFVQGQASSPPNPGRVTIPISASIHGVGGTFFHTDVTVLNTSGSAPANLAVRYRCFTGSCGNAAQNVVLAPREMRAFEDIIASLFSAPESGGAIQFDSDQPIVVNSRLHTPSRPAPTNGMGVPGLPESGAPIKAVLTSLSYSADSSAGFRSNVGAYNGNDVSQMITFTIYDPAGTQLGQVSANAPARTSVQVSSVFAVAGITRDVPDAYCVVQGDRNLPLLVYAGVIDNQSQDLAFIRGESDSP
jgi:virginiamycin B lyase